jgi:light-regulated signal transduction histidine kinase (bacteriophytochrome)
VEIGLTPVETGDGLLVLAAVADITKRRIAEDARRKYAAALQRSNEDLQQFAYVASHDLQEPLRKIARFCDLVESSYADKLDEEGKSYIRFAVDSANRLRNMVKDLLVYSRVQLQDAPFRKVDAHQALLKAIENLQWTIEESEADVTYERLPTVFADELQLIQLFQNLIGNAIKYRGDAKPRIHVQFEENEREWVFSVRDNGIGIAPEFHQRIFGIFKRLHGPHEFSGTGIGLAICKRIVERLGGTLWIESEVGQGSTFLFTLPRDREPVEPRN